MSTNPTRPVVTGYPAPPNYPYPPPPPHHHYYPQQQNQYISNPTPNPTFLRRIFTIIIASTILFIAISLIAYLILKPQFPIFHITSASVSNFTITNSSLVSFTSEIHLSCKNPNRKMRLDYDRVQAGMFYKWYTLSETSVTPFGQEKEGRSDVVAGFASAGGFVDREVVDGIEKEKSRGVVEFGFSLVCSVGFEAKAWRTRRYVRVFCPLVVEFTGGDGRLRGGNRLCRVIS